MVPPVALMAVALLLALLLAVGVVLPPSLVAERALPLASVVAVGAVLLLATPLALPVLTANLPERWRSLPRPAQPNRQGWGHQQQNSPARVPNPILQMSQLPLANPPAPARSATMSWGGPSPHWTDYGRVGHGALSHTDVHPGGTTPACSPPPAASSRAT